MAKKIQLTIDEPCHENWDQMSPADKGRFCGSCQKQVVDFSDMSDREVAQFFKKPSTGSVCGRFMQDQLDRDIMIPKKKIPWIKYFFQFALPAFFLSLKANSQQITMGKPSLRTTTPVKTLLGDTTLPVALTKSNLPPKSLIKQITCEKTYVTMGVIAYVNPNIKITKVEETIKGKVIDENGEPVPYASIMIEGSTNGTHAGEDGQFSIKPSSKLKRIDMVISSSGFEEKKITVNQNTAANDMVIQLQSKSVLKEVTIVCYPVQGMIRRVDRMGAVSVIKDSSKAIATKTVKAIATTGLVPEPFQPRLEIYPNPVVSGSMLNIGCRKMEDGYYSLQLLSQSGQLIMQKEIWIDDEAVVLNIDMPSTPAGAYFLRLINKKSGKNFTEKIIVQ